MIMLRTLNQLIKYHGDCAQYNNGSNHHVELEDLRAIDDQLSESPSCRQKFSDNDAHQRQADIDLHAA